MSGNQKGYQYVGNEDLSKTKFSTQPFSGQPDEKEIKLRNEPLPKDKEEIIKFFQEKLKQADICITDAAFLLKEHNKLAKDALQNQIDNEANREQLSIDSVEKNYMSLELEYQVQQLRIQTKKDRTEKLQKDIQIKKLEIKLNKAEKAENELKEVKEKLKFSEEALKEAKITVDQQRDVKRVLNKYDNEPYYLKPNISEDYMKKTVNISEDYMKKTAQLPPIRQQANYSSPPKTTGYQSSPPNGKLDAFQTEFHNYYSTPKPAKKEEVFWNEGKNGQKNGKVSFSGNWKWSGNNISGFDGYDPNFLLLNMTPEKHVKDSKENDSFSEQQKQSYQMFNNLGKGKQIKAF